MLETLQRLFSPTDELPSHGRRALLAGLPAGMLGASAALLSTADATFIDPDDGFIRFSNSNEKFKALFRLERDLRDEGTTVSTYQFITYALPQGDRPQPIVRWEGMEFSYFRRVGDLIWRIHAHNVSYPRDLHTGEFTSRAPNPFTGEMLEMETGLSTARCQVGKLARYLSHTSHRGSAHQVGAYSTNARWLAGHVY